MGDVAALYLSRAVVEGLSGWPLADELRAAFAENRTRAQPAHARIPRRRCRRSSRPRPGRGPSRPRASWSTSPGVCSTRSVIAAPSTCDTSQRAATGPSRMPFTPTGWRSRRAASTWSAWVPHYDEFRTFAVERIERLTVGEETFRKTRELPTRSRSAGRWAPSGPSRSASSSSSTPRVAPYVRGRMWHDSQHLDELPDGRVRMTLDVSNDWALRSWVLGFGASVRVVKPAALADAVLDELKRACHVYEPKLDLQDARPPVDAAPPLPI